MSEHEEEEDEFKFLEALRDMLAPKNKKNDTYTVQNVLNIVAALVIPSR